LGYLTGGLEAELCLDGSRLRSVAVNLGPDASYTSRCHNVPSDVESTDTFDVKLWNLTIGIFDATHLLDSGTKTLNKHEQFES